MRRRTLNDEQRGRIPLSRLRHERLHHRPGAELHQAQVRRAGTPDRAAVARESSRDMPAAGCSIRCLCSIKRNCGGTWTVQAPFLVFGELIGRPHSGHAPRTEGFASLSTFRVTAIRPVTPSTSDLRSASRARSRKPTNAASTMSSLRTSGIASTMTASSSNVAWHCDALHRGTARTTQLWWRPVDQLLLPRPPVAAIEAGGMPPRWSRPSRRRVMRQAVISDSVTSRSGTSPK